MYGAGSSSNAGGGIGGGDGGGRALPSTVRQTRTKQQLPGSSNNRAGSPSLDRNSPPHSHHVPQQRAPPRPKTKKQQQPGGPIKGVKMTIGGKTLGGDEDERAAYEEAQFILRLPEGLPATEKFRQAIADNEPPEDFKIRFHSDRRATVTLDGQDYRATLKDLPTVNESWKTYDRVTFWKIADVHQMLVVEGPEPPKAEDMPEVTKEEYELKDGLTPPMKNVVNKRFRKPQIKQQIEDVEKEVQRLLERDKQAFEITTQWKLLPTNMVNDAATDAGDGEADDEEMMDEAGSDDLDVDELANDLEMGIADSGSGSGSGSEEESEESSEEEDETVTKTTSLKDKQVRLESELKELGEKIAEKEAASRSGHEWTRTSAMQQLVGLRRDYNEKRAMLEATKRELRGVTGGILGIRIRGGGGGGGGAGPAGGGAGGGAAPVVVKKPLTIRFNTNR